MVVLWLVSANFRSPQTSQSSISRARQFFGQVGNLFFFSFLDYVIDSQWLSTSLMSLLDLSFCGLYIKKMKTEIGIFIKCNPKACKKRGKPMVIDSGLHPRMPFPRNRIFHKNIQEKSSPEHPRPATSRPVLVPKMK